MNKAESRYLEISFEHMGLTPADTPEQADIIILNTCSVRKTAEERIIGRLGYFTALKRKHEFELFVMGCMAERLRGSLKETFSSVDGVVGTFDKQTFLDNVRETVDKQHHLGSLFLDKNEYEFPPAYTNGRDITAFVPIMHGCNNYCTYCIVPYVRGREVSRGPASIVNEIAALDRSGCREITVLGQNVNSYSGSENGAVITFPELLERIVEATSDEIRIRFLTSHPKDFSPNLISSIKEHDQLCRGIHLPVQSGSNAVLARMNRKYTREDYIEIITALKREIPDISVSTDLIVGFPGETEKDFRQTLELVKKVEFEDAFTYKYNPREGTTAYAFEDTVPEEEKKDRLQQLIDLQRSISINSKRKKIDNTVKVLIEGVSKKSNAELLGRTEYNEMVVFPGEKKQVGAFTYVKLTSLSGNTFKGEQIV
jgi:tRNA-2-methylthio-N6-dimethylallyladenosine synthase